MQFLIALVEIMFMVPIFIIALTNSSTKRVLHCTNLIHSIGIILHWIQSLDTASIAAFEKDSVSFVRAMDLYGVSLRKGETPDEISRKGDENCVEIIP